MDGHKSSLYRWKRQTNPRVYSRSQHVTSVCDVQDWLKKVEDASEVAGNEVLGEAIPTWQRDVTHRQKTGVCEATRVMADTRQYDETFTEAQDLLQEWMTDKLLRDSYTDSLAEGDPEDENWSERRYHREVQKEWDRLLEDNGEDLFCRARPRRITSDPYENLYGLEEDDAVDAVIDNLLKRDYVRADKVTKDVDVHKSQVDPRLKMQLRQDQVKKNRLLREETCRKKQDEKKQKKDAMFSARQLIQKETAEKERGKKREELLIQQEMARIRKEMRDEEAKRRLQPVIKESNWCDSGIPNKNTLPLNHKQKHVSQSPHHTKYTSQQSNHESYRPKENLHHLNLDGENYTYRGQLDEFIKRDTILHNTALDAECRILEFSRRMQHKVLRRHFTLWYDVVLDRRAQLGRVTAIADWKLVNRTWTTWRKHCRERRLERDMRREECHAKEAQRKIQMARENHRLLVLRKSFVCWQIWTEQSITVREEAANKQRREDKMAAFLRAAESRLQNDLETERNVKSPQAQKPKKSTTENPHAKRPSSKPNTPRQAWQITNKDIKVTKDDIETAKAKHNNRNSEISVYDDSGENMSTDGNIPLTARNIPQSRKDGEIPLSERNVTTSKNGYQHRHTAQQKMLKDQKKLIKDQQRMIEDLQFEQNRQVLQDQASQYSQIQKQLADNQRYIDSQVKTSTGIGQDNAQTDRSNISATKSVSTCTVTSKPTTARLNDFVKNMSERAAERAKLKVEREEKRKLDDQERLEQLKLEEAEKESQIMEDKREKQRVYQEKKKLDKQKEEERMKQQEKLKEKMAAADAHYKMATMKYRGYLPWRKLLDMCRRQMEVAKQHAERRLLSQSLSTWRIHVADITASRNQQVDELHKKIVVRRCFLAWSRYKDIATIQDTSALTHYNTRLLRRVTLTWLDYATDEKMKSWRNERLAQEHNIRRLMKRCFRSWVKFPDAMKTHAETERRRLDVRRRVAQLLPDYSLNESVRQSDSYL